MSHCRNSTSIPNGTTKIAKTARENYLMSTLVYTVISDHLRIESQRAATKSQFEDTSHSKAVKYSDLRMTFT